MSRGQVNGRVDMYAKVSKPTRAAYAGVERVNRELVVAGSRV